MTPDSAAIVEDSIGRLDPRAVLAEHYGLDGSTVRQLGGEVDRNFRVDAPDGTRYLLKVTAGDPCAPIDWQEAILEHLALKAPDLPVPRLVPGLRGERHLTVPVGDSTAVVRLLTWLDGIMLADVPTPPLALLGELGTMSARLTQALSDFPSGLMQHRHHWDVRASRESVDLCLPFVDDPQDRASVTAIMRVFDGVNPGLDELPMGVVHQDLNDFNVLVSGQSRGSWAVSGIVDFGDALYTVRVADVAVAGAYAMLRQPDPIAALSAVVVGFHEHAPLSAEELAVVFPLAAARLCVNATTWTRRTVEAHRPYGIERMRFTWPTIRKLAGASELEVLERIHADCEFSTQSRSRPPGDE